MDDTIVAVETKEILNNFMDKIAKLFNVKVMGEPTRFLGYNILWDYIKGIITL